MKLINILDNLEVPNDHAILYFHIASNVLKASLNINTNEIFEVFNYYYDKSSTICMPSFPFTGSNYYDYLSKDPIFDVRHTPSKVNLITEVFRRMDKVIRSIHPWCSVSCMGKLAKEFVSEHHKGIKVFGETSPFWKIKEIGGVVVGLGVDCNTNSFAHMPDDELLNYHSFKVYEEPLYSGRCIDYQGNLINVKTNVLYRHIGEIIKPRKMRNFYLGQKFYKELSISGVNFFSLKVKEFIDFTVKINMERVIKGELPIYYEK